MVVALLLGLAAAAANADTEAFSGRSGIHRHWTWAPDWGLRPYRISGTVYAAMYSRGRHKWVAHASLGIFYSTEALSPDTLLVYGFEYRKKGGHWRSVCIRHRCLFDSRKRAPWPGEPVGGQYFHVKLSAKRLRNIQQIRLSFVPLTETAAGRHVGKHNSHTFNVHYFRCRTCVLPSHAAPPPAPAPAPQPAPGPPPVAHDACVAHPSDPSVVCVRNRGHTVDVCDRDPDGHRAYARVITDASRPNFRSPFYDDNDSQAGCANLPFPSTVRGVAVCVQYEGCSAFRRT